jgi:hypothetical protein
MCKSQRHTHKYIVGKINFLNVNPYYTCTNKQPLPVKTLAVTICTTVFYCSNIPRSAHIMHLHVSRDPHKKSQIVSTHGINKLVCVTQTESVYCAVRNSYLNIVQVKFSLNIARAVRRRTLTGEARVRYQASPCKI